MAKRVALATRVATVMDVHVDEAVRVLDIGLRQCVRINPLKGDPKETLRAMLGLGWRGEPVQLRRSDRTGGDPVGYTITDGYEQLRDSELITAGKIYIQNSSSWLPVVALDPLPGERVLDVCAAPGGKSSHIAALMQGSGELVVNDNSRARLAKLRANLLRLGVHAEYTLRDATRLAQYVDGASYDKILLDAPCSGEGLIRLSQPKTLDSWSVAHVRRLATLQQRLIEQAWRLLRPGGRLVYSTCTMAPEENEMVVHRFLRRHDDAVVESIPVGSSSGASHGIAEWNGQQFGTWRTQVVRVFPKEGAEAFFVASIHKQNSKIV